MNVFLHHGSRSRLVIGLAFLFTVFMIQAIEVDEMVPESHTPNEPTECVSHKELRAKISMLQSKLAASEQDISQHVKTIAQRDKTITEQNKVQARLSKTIRLMEQSSTAPPSPNSQIELIGAASQQGLSVEGIAEFDPASMSGAGTGSGTADEKSAKASGSRLMQQRTRAKTRPTARTPTRATSTDDEEDDDDEEDGRGRPMEWNVQYPKGGPINAENSRCRKFWFHFRGPGKVGPKAAAFGWPKIVATTRVMVKKRNTSNTWHVGRGPESWARGETYSRAARWGCSGKIRGYGTGAFYQICGCYELWCPMLDGHLGNKKDKRKSCFSLRKLFGCFKATTATSWKFVWSQDCRGVRGHLKGKLFMEVTLF